MSSKEKIKTTKVRLKVSGPSPIGFGELRGSSPFGVWKFTRNGTNLNIWQQGRFNSSGRKHGWWEVFSSSGQSVASLNYNNGRLDQIRKHHTLHAIDLGEISVTDLFFIPGLALQKL